MANNIATRLANRPGPSFNVAALNDALDTARARARMTWSDVAAQVGVVPSTMTRIHHGQTPDATTLIRLMAWLGIADITGFVSDPTTTDQEAS